MAGEAERGCQVDLVARGHQVLALPMLGTALGWRGRVAGAVTAAPLARILAECCERLLALLQRYISDMARRPVLCTLASYTAPARCAYLPAQTCGNPVLPELQGYLHMTEGLRLRAPVLRAEPVRRSGRRWPPSRGMTGAPPWACRRR